MSVYKLKDEFIRACEAWLCDSYSATVQYLALRNANGITQLAEAVITVAPLPGGGDLDFIIDESLILVGQMQLNNLSSEKIKELLADVCDGTVTVEGERLSLGGIDDLGFHSDMIQENRWFSDLHLDVIGPRPASHPDVDFQAIDNQLRISTPPFDGLADVCGWLGLSASRQALWQPSIKIRMLSPVDLSFPETTLRNNQLQLTLHAHPSLDVAKIEVAIKTTPGVRLHGRQQVASQIRWAQDVSTYRNGIALVTLDNAENVLVMLMLSGRIVRRQWFVDSSKAANPRFTVMRHFDEGLSRLEKQVFETNDSRDFEKGISSLLYLMGFASAVCAEHNAPDIILSTPSGRIALIECTLRTSDFANKLGKLVDRGRSAAKALPALGVHADIFSVLVCALPIDQIKHAPADLKAHRIALVTRENLMDAFERLRGPQDPDGLLNKLEQSFMDESPFGLRFS